MNLETERSHHHTCSYSFASTQNQEDIPDGIGRSPKPMHLRAEFGVDREAQGFVVVRSVAGRMPGSSVVQSK